MASMDGPCTLEYWIEESVYNVSDDVLLQIIELLEPIRESIENALDCYEPEEQSWRDFRNSLWYSVPKELEEKVDRIINDRQKTN